MFGEDVTGDGNFIDVVGPTKGDDIELASADDGFALAIKIHSGGSSVLLSNKEFFESENYFVTEITKMKSRKTILFWFV